VRRFLRIECAWRITKTDDRQCIQDDPRDHDAERVRRHRQTELVLGAERPARAERPRGEERGGQREEQRRADVAERKRPVAGQQARQARSAPSGRCAGRGGGAA
jgi:hypothetical protein